MPFLVPGHMQLCIRPRPLEIHQWQAQGTYLFAKNSKKTTTIVSLEKYLLIRVNN